MIQQHWGRKIICNHIAGRIDDTQLQNKNKGLHTARVIVKTERDFFMQLFSVGACTAHVNGLFTTVKKYYNVLIWDGQ